jgi:hypothetical protein
MNKKFFTLIASAFMLVASLGTVNAQGTPVATDKVTTGGLPAANQKYLYHLVGETRFSSSTQQYYLTVDNSGALQLQTPGASGTSFGNALWCVNVKDAENQGLNPTFEFNNKGAGLKLGVSAKDTAIAPPATVDVRFGALSRFDFSLTYKTVLEEAKPLKLYYNTDSILTFVDKGTGEIGIREYLATDPAVTQGTYADSVILFTLYRPQEITLTATQFNTILNTEQAGFVTLNFDPAPSDASEFQTAIQAEAVTAPVAGTPGVNSGNPNVFTGVTGNWLKFKNASNRYLRVDTLYTGEYGIKFLKFAFGDGPSTATEQKFAIEKQYYFQARYNVLNDSLAIDVMQAILPTESYNGNWYQYPHKTQWGVIATGATVDGKDSLHVKLQDLIAGERSIITIGTTEVSTRIELGLKSCADVSGDLTSIPHDLYTIKNDDDQYLVVLINTDTVTGSQRSAPRWMTLNEATQDPNRIPAFQWVVEQTRSDDFPKTSPIRITNREFGAGSVNTALTIADETIQLTTNGALLYNELINVDNFIPVPWEQKTDKYLGYKFLPDDSLRFNTYDFNYLHELNAEKYLFIKNSVDSSIYLNTATTSRTQFELIAQGTPQRYGYHTDSVKDLAPLEKVSYVLRVKDGNAFAQTGAVVVTDGEGRYAVSKNPSRTAVFLLKTNNTKEGRDFYALLDTGSYGYTYAVPHHKDVKLGIDDANAWAYEQDLNEFRTSTFFIAPYNEPLYRRFDGAEYGKYKIKEPYKGAQPDKDGVISDNAPLWLKFAKHNNWGTEFLFENSPSGWGSKDPNKKKENEYRDDLSAAGKASISFLGLYNIKDYPELDAKDEKGQGPRNYTFYVDTAYVRNNTPMPQYMLAIRPTFVAGDTIFTTKTDSTWYSDGRPPQVNPGVIDTTVMPSYTRGLYLFNAQDSIGLTEADNANAHNTDYVGKIEYGAQRTTRLAFVDGVHMGDTFYVLRNNPLVSAVDSDYLAAIPRADKHYLGQNTHYKPRWDRNGVPQWGANGAYTDAHNGKSMVFQFRLYDADGASDQDVADKMVRKFMIESQQLDGTEIGPLVGRWVKILNSVPLISDRLDLNAAIQNGAEIFNVVRFEGDEDKAVGNEATVSSSVKVIGGVNSATILNAGGKKVTISNILGQTVASKVASSDNVTIALPKGIVVVAVEGEAAVKAIVK